ncbi:MAG TPA: heme-binding protein [Saprospiraceae bacterium]|nr:heme-binding protein [Saprospiraceae bacterium]
MISKYFLSLDVAKRIAARSEEMAIKNGWEVCIAIVNSANQLVYFLKMDCTSGASVDISIAKAKHSAHFKRDTKHHADQIKAGNNLILAFPNAMPVEGGTQLIYKGESVGGIGVSGVASEDDAALGRYGAEILTEI